MQNHSEKSRSVSKESDQATVSTICKGINPKKKAINFRRTSDQVTYGNKFRLDLNKSKIKNLQQESCEIYSKIHNNRLRLPKDKRLSAKMGNKMCPITIIQAPITVNGDSSVNVHQSIVLSTYVFYIM
jgi:hypothetical protein